MRRQWGLVMHRQWCLALMLAAGAAFGQAERGALQAPEQVELYEIDVERSEIYWLIYRAGALRRFGHNHVVSVGGMTGQILLHPQLEQSQFEIEIPVEALIVDDPELRAKESEAFDSEPSDDDIQATRQNMLSDAVLNAKEYPTLRITGTGPTVHAGEESFEVTIDLLGRSIPVTLPTSVETSDDLLEAAGAFQLTHEMLGMEPFRAMMGALAVAEPLDFTYRIVARRVE